MPRPRVGFKYLDAGDALTFTGPDSTWLTLPRRNFGNFIDYSISLSNLTVPLPIPSALALDIPGTTFQGFANLLFADVAAPGGFVPASGQLLTVGTSYRWAGNPGNSDTFVSLVHFSSRVTGNISTVACNVREDDEFELLTSTVAELNEGFSGAFLAPRFSPTAQLQDDALLVAANRYGVEWVDHSLDELIHAVPCFESPAPLQHDVDGVAQKQVRARDS